MNQKKEKAQVNLSNFKPPSTLFSSENFKKFDEKDFIENLTYRILNEAKKSTSYDIYCDAFERLFNDTLTELQKLRLEEMDNSESSIHEIEENEKIQTQKLKNLTEELDPISEKLKSLEDNINKVGNTTVQIGNNLETIDSHKKRAIEADKLIRYINEFNKYDPDKFTNVMLPLKHPDKTSSEQLAYTIFTKNCRKGAAKKIKQLNLIVKDLGKVQSCVKAVINIKAYSEMLESILLQNFLKPLKCLDLHKDQVLKKLERRANVLFDFNSKDKCIDLYVGERYEKILKILAKISDKEYYDLSDDSEDELAESFDLETNYKLESTPITTTPKMPGNAPLPLFDHVDDDLDDVYSDSPIHYNKDAKSSSKSDLKNAILESVKNLKDFKDYLGTVESLIQKEYLTIREIFPNHEEEVVRKLLTQIAKDAHSVIIENLLIQPTKIFDQNDVDILGNYLENLQQFYNSVVQHCNRLFEATPKLPINENFIRPLFYGIFLERRNAYISLELDHLKELYGIYIKELALENTFQTVEIPEAPQKGLLGNYLKTPRKNSGTTVTPPTPMKKRKSLNLISSATGSENTNAVQWDLDRDPLKLDFVVNLIHLNDTAIRRAITLSFNGELEYNIYEILKVLFTEIGYYVNTAFDECLHEYGIVKLTHLNNRNDLKGEPKTNIFKLLQLGNSTLYSLERHLEVSAMPSMTSSIEIRLDCLRLRDELFIPVESKVVKLLEYQLKSILEALKTIFDKDSKPDDFFRKDQSEFNNNPTTACLNACAYLKSNLKSISHTLFGSNRESFLTELGLQFYKILVNSLRTLTVSNFGAIRFMRDLSEYQKVIRQFGIDVVEAQFNNLRECSNIFIVKSENIESILIELDKTISKEELYQFVKMRDDFKKNQLNKLSFFANQKFTKIK